MEITYAELTDKGARREENQDSLFCAEGDGTGLFAVADGMGGHSDGAYASNAVTEAVARWWKKHGDATALIEGSFLHTDSIKDALSEANDRIRESVPQGTLCGSTAVVLWIEDSAFSVLSCGDSRCYISRKKTFSTDFACLTTDDVWENDADKTDGLESDEILTHKNYGKLMRAIGTEKRFSCSVVSDELADGTAFLLCSDGVYKYADMDEIEKIMKKACRWSTDLSECVERIRELTFMAGAPDNLSAVIVRVTGKK